MDTIKLNNVTVIAGFVAPSEKPFEFKDLVGLLERISKSDTPISNVYVEPVATREKLSDVKPVSKRDKPAYKKDSVKTIKLKKPKKDDPTFTWEGEYWDYKKVSDNTGWSYRHTRYEYDKRKKDPSIANPKSAYKKCAIRAIEAARKRGNLIVCGF